MTDNEYTDNDPMWSVIQQAFTPEDAITFRSYPARIENTVREIDYFIFHRSGTSIVILAQPFDEEDLSNDRQSFMEGVSVRDEFSGETLTYYPVSRARQFLRSLQMSYDLPDQTIIIIWFPNVSKKSLLQEYNIHRVDNVIFLFGDDISSDELRNRLSSLLDSAKRERLSLDAWINMKLRLKPVSSIQSRTPKLNRLEQIERARELSDIYANKYRKSTLIFISYRRDDAGWPAGRIYSQLSAIFEGNIFFDYQSIKPGANWVNAIDQALDDCIIQLVVMGRKWTTLKKRGAKQTRIMTKGDMVAHEIRMALRKNVTTIPMLIDNAGMPTRKQLPNGLKSLPLRNAVMLNQDSYFAKMDTVIDRIIELLEMAVKP